MNAPFLTLASLVVLSALPVAAVAAAPAPDAMANYAFLAGDYACSTTDNEKYVETWTHPFGGALVRAVDTVDGKPDSEHTLSYDAASKTWYVWSAGASGYSDVMAGQTDTAFQGLAPGENETMHFTKLSETSYSVKIDFTKAGKAQSWTETCAKA